MYNDTIKAANKIISSDDLYEIFTLMQERLGQLEKTYNLEKMKNQMLDYKYQTWTFKDNSSNLTFDVDFTDDTSVKFDNYNNFISVFNNRLDEIKKIYVHYSIIYSVVNLGIPSKYYRQYIDMHIRENKMDIEVSLSSQDDKINDIYELIKNKILNAPPKYDKIIKKKNIINNVIALASGFIPAIVILTLLMLVPTIRHLYGYGYVVYPIACLVFAFVIGSIISGSKLDKWYDTISPDQKYAGYDSSSSKSIYKDDIDSYIKSSEILIGKNANNLENRQNILAYYEKYKKYLPYELGVMLLLSVIILFVGRI